jgi:hypothetical protein
VYAPLVLAGAILAATGFAGSSILHASLGRAAADKGDEPGIETTVYAREQLRSWDWLLWTPGLTVMLVAAGLGGLRTLALPRWLSWAARTPPRWPRRKSRNAPSEQQGNERRPGP